MTACPCGSGLDIETCCGPIVEGQSLAATPEALMRSRYTAYVLGKIEHVERTHAPESRSDFDRTEVERTAAQMKWLGLEVRNASMDGDHGSVEFAVRFRLGEHTVTQYEVSQFRRENGHWLYVSGTVSAVPPPRQGAKIGRNDPCPCGSGKKYKKCCGTN